MKHFKCVEKGNDFPLHFKAHVYLNSLEYESQYMHVPFSFEYRCKIPHTSILWQIKTLATISKRKFGSLQINQFHNKSFSRPNHSRLPAPIPPPLPCFRPLYPRFRPSYPHTPQFMVIFLWFHLDIPRALWWALLDYFLNILQHRFMQYEHQLTPLYKMIHINTVNSHISQI